ncbi:MAG: hypothetical protein EG825_00420 [Rhodocyclaceae bacterium]|nr:hypothetical protein [Rhodocyclaceae bacterium]
MSLLASIYILWLLFIVTMAGKAAWPRLSLPVRLLIAPAALLAVLMDVAFNVLIATVVLADLPREAMFTKRLERYRATGGWRSRVATCICRHLLDPFQVGGHCH